MSTRPETLAFLLDQLGDWPSLRTRRMFGEYCVYVGDKPVAFVCDDLLYVKPTDAGVAMMAPPVWGAFTTRPSRTCWSRPSAGTSATGCAHCCKPRRMRCRRPNPGSRAPKRLPAAPKPHELSG